MAALSRTEVLRGEFTCPISYELMKDPVMEGVCRHVFERSWIEAWVTDHQTCPLSLLPLKLESLQGHRTIKTACQFLAPDREEPLTEEDFEFIEIAAQMLRERRADDAAQDPPIPTRVDQAVHNLIFERLKELAKASTRATTTSTKAATNCYRKIC